jgi:hypothetical protein
MWQRILFFYSEIWGEFGYQNMAKDIRQHVHHVIDFTRHRRIRIDRGLVVTLRVPLDRYKGIIEEAASITANIRRNRKRRKGITFTYFCSVCFLFYYFLETFFLFIFKDGVRTNSWSFSHLYSRRWSFLATINKDLVEKQYVSPEMPCLAKSRDHPEGFSSRSKE